MASYLWTLSGGRITPETEYYLKWVLPLKIGWQYWHCAIVASGTKTVLPESAKLSVYDRFKNRLVATLKKGKPNAA